MPEKSALKDLLVEQLEDLVSAENQLIAALPKMAAASNEPKLREAFEKHLEQTKGHADRLKFIFETLGESSEGKMCKAMKGLDRKSVV